MRTDLSQLTSTERELVKRALEVRENAQPSYSNYYVGAALLATNGHISVGCNIERANYTSTSHAEQVAIDSLIAECGPTGIIAIAVVGAPRGSKPNAPVWPCGHCRGIIWENSLGNKDVTIISIVNENEVEISTIGELYPMGFGPEDLGIKISSH